MRMRTRETEPPPRDSAGRAGAGRWLPAMAIAALVLFAVVSGGLAWRQYRDAQHTDLRDARSRAVVAAQVFNTYFAGEIATLTAIADAPVVVHSNTAEMLAYFKRVQPKNGKLFTGGLSWIARNGDIRVSTSRRAPGAIANASDRDYFRRTLRTGLPYVSAGITAHQTHDQVIVTAVATKDPAGRVSGVLIGALLIRQARPNARSVDLGYAGLVILDRRNQSVLQGFARPRSTAGLARFAKGASAFGVLSDTTGLDGRSDHVLAYARSSVPQWTIVLDRPRSEIFATARRSLLVEGGVIAAITLIGLLLLARILVRARAEAHEERERSRRRRQRYEAEHEVATTLQRSLLAPIPVIPGIDAAARYQAGSTGLEVGGDWYDVLRRSDGIVHVIVGDVAGRGVAAAALMGQLRNAFRAYAYEHASPAAILSRLIRHMNEDELATVVCIAIDPGASEIVYASAGHPPALLRDDATGAVTRLDLVQAPPLGFASPDAVREARVPLPRYATLLGYTDGVIERRDRVIDEGIERLSAVLASTGRDLSAAALADRVIREVAAVTAADDDSALLVIRLLDIAGADDREDAGERPGMLADAADAP
jgi:serine phosphatase RsbU (regulator of sigma subunit)